MLECLLIKKIAKKILPGDISLKDEAAAGSLIQKKLRKHAHTHLNNTFLFLLNFKCRRYLEFPYKRKTFVFFREEVNKPFLRG
jgi:hypothetical protein